MLFELKVRNRQVIARNRIRMAVFIVSMLKAAAGIWGQSGRGQGWEEVGSLH